MEFEDVIVELKTEEELKLIQDKCEHVYDDIPDAIKTYDIHKCKHCDKERVTEDDEYLKNLETQIVELTMKYGDVIRIFQELSVNQSDRVKVEKMSELLNKHIAQWMQGLEN